MAKTLRLDPISGPWFLSWVLPLLIVKRCFKLSFYAISRKTNEPNLKKNDKKPNFEPPIYLQVLPLLVVRHCSKLSSYAISRKIDKPNLRKWQKPSFGTYFTPFSPNLSHQNSFSKIWLCQSIDIMVSYHHVQYQKKSMIQSWENLVMGRWTTGWSNGQTRMIS